MMGLIRRSGQLGDLSFRLNLHLWIVDYLWLHLSHSALVDCGLYELPVMLAYYDICVMLAYCDI